MTFFFWSQNFRKWPLEVTDVWCGLQSTFLLLKITKNPVLHSAWHKFFAAWTIKNGTQATTKVFGFFQQNLDKYLMCRNLQRPFSEILASEEKSHLWRSPCRRGTLDSDWLLPRDPNGLPKPRIWTSSSCAVTSRGHFLKRCLQNQKCHFWRSPCKFSTSNLFFYHP